MLKNLTRIGGRVVVSILLVLFSTTNLVQAQSMNYQLKTVQEMVGENLQQGMTNEDAIYYANLTHMIQKLDVTGQRLSDQYARNNKAHFRNRILQGDKAALRKGMESFVNMQENGFNDLVKMQEEDRKKGQLKNKYTLIYPDGSKITATSFKKKKDNSDNNKLDKNGTHLIGPWNESYEGDFISGLDDEPDDYIGGYEWEYETGINKAKVKVILEWTLTIYGVTPTWVGGTEYYSGVLSLDTTNSVKKGVVDYRNPNTDLYIQAYHDVRVKVSSAFSASFLLMSININAQSSWHQYSIVEVSGLNSLYCYYGQYI